VLSRLNPQEVANLAWAAAASGGRPPGGLFDALAARAVGPGVAAGGRPLIPAIGHPQPPPTPAHTTTGVLEDGASYASWSDWLGSHGHDTNQGGADQIA